MAAIQDADFKAWQRSILRHQVLRRVLPASGSLREVAFWDAVLDTIREEVRKRQEQVRSEKDKDQREQLKRALARVRGDFGRRRRTFKAALLKNPPSIPLWGVFSSHPDTVVFKTWTVEQVVERAGALKGAFTVKQDDAGEVRLHCQRHEDVARIVLRAPPGECTIANQQPEQLVADTANKLCGIEHYFGRNALGAHPRCTHHMNPKVPRDLRCISSVSTQGVRSIEWFCNECAAPCKVQSPALEPAVTQLPAEVFDGHNKIPQEYDTHMRDELSDADLLHIIRILPRRKAPGPDSVPNELLRLLPTGALMHIKEVLNRALVQGVFPKWWKEVVVTLMTKKAPAERLSNQRPVALCNTVYKLFSIVLNSRLTRAVEENSVVEPEQAVGRRHRGTPRPLQWLQWQLGDAKRRRRKLYALWIDTTNAFGSVSHEVLWSILAGYGFKEKEVEYLRTLYQGSRFRVLGPFGDTAEIYTHAGVNQGDITSPLLWNLVINAMLRYIHGARVGYTHASGVMTSALAYIDDCVFLSDTDRGLQEQV